MRDDCNSGVIQVEPGGDLPIGDDENVPHPGGVSLHGAQRVAELLVVLESARRHVLVLLGLDGHANGKKKKKILERHPSKAISERASRGSTWEMAVRSQNR